MRSNFKKCIFFMLFYICAGSYHEQYRVPRSWSAQWESYSLHDREFVVQNLPVSWENAKILCRGHHNGTLAVLDSKEKADFLAEALSESQFSIESVWVGARRGSADDPAGYRWNQGLELRRTALDVLSSEQETNIGNHYPLWVNRTRVPVPEGGADCVGLERVSHDRPVFLDLPCHLERPFVCERTAQVQVTVSELKSVRCRAGLYRVFGGRLDWHQAAAFCVLHNMNLANVGTMRCLKKLGMTMLKTRPSIESAWVGGRGELGRWAWVDTGDSIFAPPAFADSPPGAWPPMRDRTSVKQNGCLQLDRHEAHPPVFMEARCERKLHFICYQGAQALRTSEPPPSDDSHQYVLVRQRLYWQHAALNCRRMNGTLAALDSPEVLLQLLLLMGETRDEPIGHIWISGRLNMTKDPASDTVSYAWYNPGNGKRIPDPKIVGDATLGLYLPPWLDEEFSMDSPCLNLDRQDHLTGLVYGLPCDTPQYSVCMVEKSARRIHTDNSTEGYETS